MLKLEGKNEWQNQCREKEKRVPGMQLGIMDVKNSKNSSIGGGRVTKNLCRQILTIMVHPILLDFFFCHFPSWAHFNQGDRSSVFSKSLVITYQNICHHH
jgi:hypothetical protein